MIPITLTGYTAGRTLYAFFVNKSLSQWAIYRVLMTEGTGADVGRYTADIDTAIGKQLVVFDATGKAVDWIPTWPEVVKRIKFDLTVESGMATLSADVDGIPRHGAGVFNFTNDDYPARTANVVITKVSP